MSARTLVTSALPYANGPIHLGHLIGAYLPADVYVRHLRMRGDDEVLFVCGTDEHGVAITLGAEKDGGGTDFQAYVDRWHDDIDTTFQRFGIDFDVFSGTSAERNPLHAPLARAFYLRLRENGFLVRKAEDQWFCSGCQRFLADRYVSGTCPSCGADGCRGDECPTCGTWVDVAEITQAVCGVCQASPDLRPAEHDYLDLPALAEDRIAVWLAERGEHGWKPNVVKFVEGMLGDLRPRPITRDLPWGVPVPTADGQGDEAENRVLYVWFDAPIGYVSATQELLADRGEPADAWEKWWKDEDTRLVHFIGKDNIAFHALVFPSMLHGQGEGWVLPSEIPAMEFYNLEGGKFSTSENRTIDLADFLERHPVDTLRWTLLATAPETADSEFTFAEFQRRVNDELNDVIGNLASRVTKFVAKRFDGAWPDGPEDLPPEAADLLDADPVGGAIRGFRFRRSTEALLEVARAGNRFFDAAEPWKVVKQDPAAAGQVMLSCGALLRTIAHHMAPMLPGSADRLLAMLGCEGALGPWEPAAHAPLHPLAGRALGDLGANLFTKIDDDAIALEQQRLAGAD